MNHQINEILLFLFFTLPPLLLGFLIGVTIEYFSWADTKNRKLDTDFRYRYKKPISAKEFAIENFISLEKSKKFLDNKMLEFGGIVVPKNGDTEYHFDTANTSNVFDDV